MERRDYTRANKIAWDEAAPIHAEQNQVRLIESFRVPGFSCLDQYETAYLNRIGIEGKSVAQLCCNNGREILSVKNRGAGRCVGFDISAAFLAQARELAKAGGIDAEFVLSDIYEIGNDYDGAFDLIYVTIGALCWMPDLDGFFSVVGRLAKPHAHFLLYDMHPILLMFEPDDGPVPQHSYFRREPFCDEEGLDYYEGEAYKSAPMFSFLHRLSDTVNACIGAGFQIRRLEEYPHDIGFRWRERFAGQDAQFPMSFMLWAER